MVNVVVKEDVYDRLTKYRMTDKGTVTFNDAIKALLDFWDQKHK